MYTYDRRAAVQERVFTDPSGRPTGPSTPWGKADGVRDIVKGVRWVNTPGHGGLGVAHGVAEKLLSSAARRLGDYQGGYYWYEEDVQCSIPFFEHPEWAHALGHTGGKEDHEKTIQSYYPKYFEYLTDGKEAPPKLKPGMKLKFIGGPVNFGGGISFNEGDVITVESTTSSSFVFSVPHPGGMRIDRLKLPLGYYYGHGHSSSKLLIPAD